MLRCLRPTLLCASSLRLQGAAGRRPGKRRAREPPESQTVTYSVSSSCRRRMSATLMAMLAGTNAAALLGDPAGEGERGRRSRSAGGAACGVALKVTGGSFVPPSSGSEQLGGTTATMVLNTSGVASSDLMGTRLGGWTTGAFTSGRRPTVRSGGSTEGSVTGRPGGPSPKEIVCPPGFPKSPFILLRAFDEGAMLTP